MDKPILKPNDCFGRSSRWKKSRYQPFASELGLLYYVMLSFESDAASVDKVMVKPISSWLMLQMLVVFKMHYVPQCWGWWVDSFIVLGWLTSLA